MTDSYEIKTFPHTVDLKALSSASVFGNGGAFQPRPSDKTNLNTLIGHFRSTVFSVAERTADKTAKTIGRLYKRRALTKSSSLLKQFKFQHLAQKNYVTGGDDVEEILTHKLLSLLMRPNEYMHGRRHWIYHQLYLDICGVVYWRLYFDEQGFPDTAYLLPPQLVKPMLNSNGMVINYVFADNEDDPIPPNEMLVITASNLANPYSVEAGMSPLRSVLQTLGIQDKSLATLHAVMRNEGMPSGILAPKSDLSNLDEVERERLKRRYLEFVRLGAGTVMILDNDMEFTPLTWKPQDLGVLEILRYHEEAICQAWAMPLMIHRGKEGQSRAAYDTALQEWCDGAISARLREQEDFINFHLLPLFEGQESGYFYAFDDPSPKQDELLNKILVDYVDKDIYMINEARAMLGMPPSPVGDQLHSELLAQLKLGDQTHKEGSTQVDRIGDGEPATEPADADDEPDFDLAAKFLLEVAAGDLLVEAARAAMISLCRIPSDQVAAMLAPYVGVKIEPKPKPQANQNSDAEQQKRLILPECCVHTTSEKAGEAVLGTEAEPEPSDPRLQRFETILRKHFSKWRGSILASVEKSLTNLTTKGLPDRFVPVEDWSRDLADDVQPVIEIFFDDGGRELLQRVGASPDVFDVFNPAVKAFAQTAAITLSQGTLDHTTKDVNQALNEVRTAVGENLEAGEGIVDLTKRIEQVFDQLDTWQCRRIAITEAARAQNEGHRRGAIDSGVVKGFKWLTSSAPCPQCAALSGKFIELDGSLPPLHAHCYCSVEDILSDSENDQV